MGDSQIIGEFLDSILKAETVEEINRLTSGVLKNLGFEKYSYLGFNPPKYHKRTFVNSTYPSDWIEYYTRNDFIYVDPTIQNAKRTILPFSWKEPRNTREVSKPVKKFFNRGNDFGIKRGAIIPIHGPAGEFAVLALACDENDKEFEKLWKEKGHSAHLVGLYYHGVIWEKVLRRKHDPTPVLTPREIQCLQWAARGKTNWEISRIYNISQETVKAHLKKAARKLGTNNRAAAVTKAMVLGLIKIPTS